MVAKKPVYSIDTIILFFLICITGVYTYFYSVYLSFNHPIMIVCYVVLTILIGCLTTEKVFYVLFMFLPMRKLVYFGSFAFFNIILVVLALKLLIERRGKINPWVLVVSAFIIAYDITISTILCPSGSMTPLIIKWYFSCVVFFLLLSQKPSYLDLKTSMLFLNIGIAISGILTTSQYIASENITPALRASLEGAGGTLDKNTYACYCLMGAVSVLAYYLESQEHIKLKQYNVRKDAIIYFLGIFSLVVGMLMTSKSFYIVLGLVLTFVLVKMLNNLIKLLQVLMVACIGIVGLSQFTFVQTIWNNIIIRFTLATDINTLTTGRTDTYLLYISELFNQPLRLFFGAGLSTYQEVFNISHMTHNSTLELLVAWGILGGFIVIVAVIYFCRKGINKRIYKIPFYRVLPWIALGLFSQTVTMIWNDATLFFFVYSFYFAIGVVKKGENEL